MRSNKFSTSREYTRDHDNSGMPSDPLYYDHRHVCIYWYSSVDCLMEAYSQWLIT